MSKQFRKRNQKVHFIGHKRNYKNEYFMQQNEEDNALKTLLRRVKCFITNSIISLISCIINMIIMFRQLIYKFF